MEENQFDTIYHEHFSYFSFATVQSVFAAHGLRIFDVEELPTHGGSLRIFACRTRDDRRDDGAAVTELLDARTRGRHADADGLSRHSRNESGKPSASCSRSSSVRSNTATSVVGYGAPAKGNTLLNYCGIRTDFLDYTVDRSPHKQGRFLPGTHIPIYGPEKLAETRPAYVLILPWNVKEEIVESMACVRDWGGRFVVPIPNVRVLSGERAPQER